jgi:hypothetical protein
MAEQDATMAQAKPPKGSSIFAYITISSID